MWHPWLIVFTVSLAALIVVTGCAIKQFRNTPDDDIMSIGLVLLIFVSVCASTVWAFVLLEALNIGVY